MSVDLTKPQKEWIETTRAGRIRHSDLIKSRPWSTVFRLECEIGVVFFKRCGSGCEHEAKLLKWLEPKYSDYLPELLDIDMDNAWILIRDAGQPIGYLENRNKILHMVQSLLPNYAALQIGSLAQTDELLSYGIPDRRLSLAPGLLGNMLEKPFIELSNETRLVMAKKLELFEDTCLELANSSFSSALDHGDLHVWNVLAKDEKSVIIDWGDATITHPFTGIYQTLSLLFDDRFCFENPELRNLIACYLEPWTSFEPFSELWRQLKLALSIAPIMQSIHLTNILELSGETDSEWLSFIKKSLRTSLVSQDKTL